MFFPNKKYKEVSNFFENPQDVVDFAQRCTYYPYAAHPLGGDSCGKYAGLRSHSLTRINLDFQNQVIQSIIHPHIVKKYQRMDWRATMYFAKSNKSDEISSESSIQLIHKDPNIVKAGVIYLSKDIDPRSGTTLYNDKGKKIKEFKNKYNKMVLYDADINHSISKFVNNRLTLIYFIEELYIR